MITLAGQWIGRYSGSNEGQFVADIDDIGDCYRATVTAWDDRPDFPNTILRFFLGFGANAVSIPNVPIEFIDNSGNHIHQADLQRLQSGGISLPTHVNLELGLSEAALTISWTTTLGTSGLGSAPASKTRLGKPSELDAEDLDTWDTFKNRIHGLPGRQYIYRGQEDRIWRLRSSFHRTGRANLERYLVDDVSDLHHTLSLFLNRVLNLQDSLQHGAFLNLAQHHGFPTPLLDWTWSPYVAAFFAFISLQSARLA